MRAARDAFPAGERVDGRAVQHWDQTHQPAKVIRDVTYGAFFEEMVSID